MAADGDTLYKRLKWTVFWCMFVGYSSYYLTRKSFTYAMPSLIKEMSLQKSDLGVITSSYTITYGLSKFVGGILGDQVSARALFVTGLIFSGLLNIAIGNSSSLWSFTVFWSLNGLSQGLGWPPCAKLLKAWFKPFEVGTLWSLLTAACNLAASVSPILTAYLTTNYGWNAAFTFPGMAAILISGVLYFLIYNSPSERGLEGFANPNSKDKSKPEQVSEQSNRLLFSLLKSPFLWVIGLCYLSSALVKFAIADWGQLYLMQAKGKSQYAAGVAMGMFEVGGFVGSITSGYLSDRLVLKYNQSTKSSPRIPLVIGYCSALLVGLHLLRVVVIQQSSQFLVSTVVFVVGCAAYGPINMYGVLAIENAPPTLTSTTHAIVALAASVGGAMAGYPLSLITNAYGWDTLLMVLECVTVGTLAVLLCTRNVNREMVPTKKQD